MTAALILAALLTVSVGVTHSTLGELKLIGPLLAPEQRRGLLETSALARQVLRFAWHLTTVAWFGLAAILIAATVGPPEHLGAPVVGLVAMIFFVTGLVTLVMSRGRHLAWPVFFAIAALCAAALL